MEQRKKKKESNAGQQRHQRRLELVLQARLTWTGPDGDVITLQECRSRRASFGRHHYDLKGPKRPANLAETIIASQIEGNRQLGDKIYPGAECPWI
jgi:hypothetical protein